jgi:hypothetical protein
MTSTTESPKSKQKSLQISEEDMKTEIAGGTISLGDLISLEEEDVRLQYKHLNIFTT